MGFPTLIPTTTQVLAVYHTLAFTGLVVAKLRTPPNNENIPLSLIPLLGIRFAHARVRPQHRDE
jgi:hypothetical protein